MIVDDLQQSFRAQHDAIVALQKCLGRPGLCIGGEAQITALIDHISAGLSVSGALVRAHQRPIDSAGLVSAPVQYPPVRYTPGSE